jgi:hypothetical protein
MRTKILITFLFIVIASTGCSPVAAPISEKPGDPNSTVSQLLPTIPPTPASAPGSAHAQESQTIQVGNEDFWVGKTLTNGFQMHKSEKALLDKDDKVLEILDAQGRVKLENLGEYRYRYFAWEDGYDVIVGGGFLMLNAGNSYTFERSGINNREQVEVRLISNDQLLGYALLIPNTDSNGSFTGFEKPIAFVDKNDDGLVSIQELDTVLVGLGETVSAIAESQPSIASKFEADISSAYTALNSGAIAETYKIIKQIQSDLANVKPLTKDNEPGSYFIIGIVLVIGLLIALVYEIRKKPRTRIRRVKTIPGNPKKVVKNPAQLESQKEPVSTENLTSQSITQVKNGFDTNDQSGQKVVGITVCLNCRMKVLPKSDGTCPNCQSRIL